MSTDPVDPRWVGSGWKLCNNKGKPVREYEPFFTDTHHFEYDVRIGVSPLTFYDPMDRVVELSFQITRGQRWCFILGDLRIGTRMIPRRSPTQKMIPNSETSSDASTRTNTYRLGIKGVYKVHWAHTKTKRQGRQKFILTRLRFRSLTLWVDHCTR